MAGSAIDTPRTRHTNRRYLIGVIVGLAIIAGAGFGVTYRARVLSFAEAPVAYEVADTVPREPAPNTISIPAADITVSTVPGRVVDGVWSIPKNAAAHLRSSARPGEPGNIVMYGHNKPDIFKRLPTVAVGDTITVTDDERTEHRYVVREVHLVPPTDGSLIEPTDTEQLTVYTCTGFFDQDRFVVIADPAPA